MGVCPTEYSNKCNTAATDDGTTTGFPSDLCACQDPSLLSPPTLFCTDSSKVCKADSSGTFGCQSCTNGECPVFAPLCDISSGECLCGSKKPYGNPINNQDGLNYLIANTCSCNTSAGMFACGATGNPCYAGYSNPYCLDNSLTSKLGDPSSTCKVLKFYL